MKVLCKHCKHVVRADKLCSNCYQPLVDTKPIKSTYYRPYRYVNCDESDEDYLIWLAKKYPDQYTKIKANLTKQ